MSRNRVAILALTATAGAVGLYLYKAGGDAKTAEKQFEHDVRSAVSSVKGHAHDSTAAAKADLNMAVASIKSEAAEAEAMASKARDEAVKKINSFDRAVGSTAAHAKDNVEQAKKDVVGWFSKK